MMKRTTKLAPEISASPPSPPDRTDSTADIPRISSGCTVLDLALGGGYPRGRIVNIVGDKSSGKTLLVTECIAKARKMFKPLFGLAFKWFYDDAESGYTFNTQQMYKDPDFTVLPKNDYHSELIEEFESNLDKQLNLCLIKNEVLLYALDTFDGLESVAGRKRYEKKLKKYRGKNQDEGESTTKEKGSYKTEKVTSFTEFFRNQHGKILRSDALLIVISQVRANIGVMFGPQYYRTGGKALDHYAAQIIWLAEVERVEKRDRVVSVVIKARVTKNKVGKAYRECFITLLWDYGVDDLSSNIDYLFDLRDKRGKTKTGCEIKWKGIDYATKEHLIRYVEKHNEEEEIKRAVVDKWEAVEREIAPNRKAKY
uniref:Putative RecA n=2 Tax=viral metagenome TaxID=1070528 RepID=A0A6M3IM67_9ZZZZ